MRETGRSRGSMSYPALSSCDLSEVRSPKGKVVLSG